MAERVVNDALRSRVRMALLGRITGANGDRERAVDAVLKAVGLDDWEAAVDRGGHAFADHCQDRYDFRPALGQRAIVAEIVLRAALTCSATGEGQS